MYLIFKFLSPPMHRTLCNCFRRVRGRKEDAGEREVSAEVLVLVGGTTLFGTTEHLILYVLFDWGGTYGITVVLNDSTV